MEILACPNLAVPAQVMRHVVHVESGANPYAIGVVGGRLARQPKTLDEALATAQMLESKGYNYSLGAAQVNRTNFRKYGLDSYEKAFNPCTNLAAGASILAGCYASAGGDWGKAFSCYYSGNFVTGFRSGYVQRIYDSISRDATLAQAPTANAIPLRPATAPSPALTGAPPALAVPQATTAASRLSMRVVPLGTSTQQPLAVPAAAAPSPAAAVQTPVSPSGLAAKPDVFVPQVRSPAAGPLDRPVGDGAFVF